MAHERASTFRLVEPEQNTFPKKFLLWFLQVYGALVAFIVGVFSVLAWHNSDKAASQADISNLVAFLSFCGDLGSNQEESSMAQASSLCATHASIAQAQLRKYVTKQFPTPTATKGPATVPDAEPSGGLSTGVVTGIAVGCGALFAFITALSCALMLRRRRKVIQQDELNVFVPRDSGRSPPNIAIR